MTKLETEYTFEDGVSAGNYFLDLIWVINPEMTAAASQFTPPETLEKIYATLWEGTKTQRPPPCIEGFLSWALKPSRLDSDLITLWGANELIANQRAYAPVCEMPRESGVIQLGYWSGNSPGDAWCLDVNRGCIRCLPVESGCPDADTTRLASYAVFDSLWHWMAYLRCSAWERGWIDTM